MNAATVWAVIAIMLGMAIIADIVTPDVRYADTYTVTDCSGLSKDRRVEMTSVFQTCLIDNTSTNSCTAYAEKLFCEKRIIEENADGTIKKIHRVLDGVNLDE